MSTASNDPMEFLKSLWGTAGMPLPGLITPTLDTNELDKRVADLKAVEGWLKTNLGMLQMTIQGLEMQRATLAAMQAMSQSISSSETTANPFANPALWPWNFSQQGSPASNSPATQDAATETPPDEASNATTPSKTRGKGK
ncbi:MAG: hypothetical protein CVU17_07080 [Betaproteobacteria bacterium HGW-Betaproteobacteria-11]|nr:MAG: hypothetical protein CVU17_07080 [Betaproteobacteria bacterium HGW-Betaproteobacteria-11]